MAKQMGPTVIGPLTLVDFPKFGIKGVPAKVDTGADSSSIWATNIKEADGKLSFCLFGTSSPFYTGQTITTRDYEINSVKNSFGHSEFRYKVKLQVKIEGRLIRARFNLANRSGNTYPILIGRRTLHGRFLVDVSSAASRKNYKVLVLVDRHKELYDDYFRKFEAAHKKIRSTVADYSQLAFYIDGPKTKVTLSGSGKDIKDFDLVYFKTVLVNRDIAAAAASYLQKHNVMFMDRAVLGHYTNNKLKQYMVLQKIGIEVPKSLFFPSSTLPEKYSEISRYVGTPFILKSIKGKKGRFNYLINDEKAFKRACKKVAKDQVELIAQQYVPNDGDYRLLVFGKHVRMIIHRRNDSGKSHLNNVSAGGTATLAEQSDVPSRVRELGIKAADMLGIDIAGVDMVQDKASGKWYCLEVNKGPQLTSGAYLPEKEDALSEFLYGKLKRLI